MIKPRQKLLDKQHLLSNFSKWPCTFFIYQLTFFFSWGHFKAPILLCTISYFPIGGTIRETNVNLSPMCFIIYVVQKREFRSASMTIKESSRWDHISITQYILTFLLAVLLWLSRFQSMQKHGTRVPLNIPGEPWGVVFLGQYIFPYQANFLPSQQKNPNLRPSLYLILSPQIL